MLPCDHGRDWIDQISDQVQISKIKTQNPIVNIFSQNIATRAFVHHIHIYLYICPSLPVSATLQIDCTIAPAVPRPLTHSDKTHLPGMIHRLKETDHLKITPDATHPPPSPFHSTIKHPEETTTTTKINTVHAALEQRRTHGAVVLHEKKDICCHETKPINLFMTVLYQAQQITAVCTRATHASWAGYASNDAVYTKTHTLTQTHTHTILRA